jgi:hypothetical protein
MPTNQDKRVLFAFTPANQAPDKVPTLMFVMPEAAWDHIARGILHGVSHDFDLTVLGIPLRVFISRCKTRKSGLEDLRKLGIIDAETKDVQSIDIGMDKDPPSRQ